jgi:hypothetical protein
VARPLGADSLKDGRGVAVGDLNGDGRLDIVVNNNNAAPTVYLNRLRGAGDWLGIRLVGTRSNRDAVGARARITLGEGAREKVLLRQVEAGSGYASQSDLALHIGTGRSWEVRAVEITWPSGLRQNFRGPELRDRRHRRFVVREGNPELVPDPAR